MLKQHEYQTENERLWEMLLQFIKEENKEAIEKVRTKLNRNQLLFEQEGSEYELEIHIIANGCCEECKAIDEKVVQIKDELKNQTLPYNQCIRPHTGCVCCYTMRVKFDKNDDPVMRKP